MSGHGSNLSAVAILACGGHAQFVSEGLQMFSKLGAPIGDTLTVFIDGVGIAAERRETVAAVLMRQPLVHTRTTGISGAKRAPFCMMGVCFDCLAVVDGALVQTCLTPVSDGMQIQRQQGRRKVIT